MRSTISAWGGIIGVLGLALIVALTGTVTAPSSALAHEGESHGDAPPPPPTDLTGIMDRGVATGTSFQFVAYPTAESLAIFVDHVETNMPVTGAFVEVLAGDDTSLVAEETMPGVYLAPWPPAGTDADAIAGMEMVVTIVADSADELMIVTFPGGEASVNKARPTSPTLVASESSGVRSWLPIVGGIIAVFGAVAGYRNRGPGRWIGFSAIAIGLVMGFSTSGLL